MRQKNLLRYLMALILHTTLIIHICNLNIVVLASNMNAVILMRAARLIANQTDRNLIINGHLTRGLYCAPGGQAVSILLKRCGQLCGSYSNHAYLLTHYRCAHCFQELLLGMRMKVESARVLCRRSMRGAKPFLTLTRCTCQSKFLRTARTRTVFLGHLPNIAGPYLSNLGTPADGGSSHGLPSCSCHLIAACGFTYNRRGISYRVFIRSMLIV